MKQIKENLAFWRNTLGNGSLLSTLKDKIESNILNAQNTVGKKAPWWTDATVSMTDDEFKSFNAAYLLTHGEDWKEDPDSE